MREPYRKGLANHPGPESGADGSTAYDAANRQTTFGDKTLTYDNNGNVTSIVDASGTTIYTWNARNQLTHINGPGVNASFVYDGLGRREKKTIGGNLTEFLYDGLNPVQESSGVPVTANILTGLGIDEFFSRTDVPAAITSHFLPDALGSTLALADAAGTVQTEYTYEPFGRTTASGGSNSNSYQYTGRENDGTGLYYYRGRYYHPQFQRFFSEDPIEFGGGDVNLYAYVQNEPLSYIDPFGTAKGGKTRFFNTGDPLSQGLHRGMSQEEKDAAIDRIKQELKKETLSKGRIRFLRGLMKAIARAGFVVSIILELADPAEAGSGSDIVPPSPRIPSPGGPSSPGGPAAPPDDDCPWDGTKCGPPAEPPPGRK